MTFRLRPQDYLRICRGGQTETEERSWDAEVAQDIEQPVRIRWLGSVVECQRDFRVIPVAVGEKASGLGQFGFEVGTGITQRDEFIYPALQETASPIEPDSLAGLHAPDPGQQPRVGRHGASQRQIQPIYV